MALDRPISNHFSIGMQNGLYNITFSNTLFDNGTDLFLAITTIHEIGHAMILTTQDELIPDNVELSYSLEWYSSFLEEYGFLAPLSQHEIMMDMVEDFALSLENYGVLAGYNYTSEYYEDLAWAGLTQTDTFDYYFPLNIPGTTPGTTVINPVRQRILNRILTEQENETQTDYYGNIYTPKGQVPNPSLPCN